jgi:hypothetical protein
VSVVVDPDGYITSHGILRPTREFQFLADPEKYSVKKPLIKPIEKEVTFATVWAASVNGSAKFELEGGARLGPGRIYGLEVEGTFSTRPGSVFEARATGRANLSAWAKLEAKLKLELNAKALGVAKVARVTPTIIGSATVRAYVEIQPTFERIATSKPDEADYRITGKLEAAGAVDLGLRGYVDFKVLGFGPRINFGRYELRLGSMGMTAEISHVLGSNDPIELKYELTEFDENKFASHVEDLIQEEEEEDTGKHEETLEQKDATKAPPLPTKPTELSRRFFMNRAPHTLWLEHTPGPVLKMASDGDDKLTTKLAAEIGTVEQQQQAQEGDEAALLAQEASQARGLLAQAQAVERGLAALGSEENQNPDAAGFQEIASGLANYGDAYDKTDLATTAPAPSAAGGVTVDSKGRFVITNQAELDAVRAAKPSRPADLDEDAEPLWNDYAEPGKGYFDRYIDAIARDLSARPYRVRHDPPLTWESYIESRGFYDRLRERKDFQSDLRKTILAERGDIDPQQAEIDVGLQKGRRRVRYADIVITTASGNLEVYSLKVRNVAAQVHKLKDRGAVEKWISDNLESDIKEAKEYYGGQVTFRRKYKSTAEGKAGGSKEGKHPLHDEPVFVNKVILVWRGASDLVPADFRDYILDTGVALRALHRKTIDCEVRLQP